MDNNISEVFKTLLKNTSTTSSSNSESSQNSLNITPEMITQLANTIKSTNYSNNTDNTDKNNSTSKVNPEKNLNLDFDTLLKIKNIIECFNEKDDTRANLLYSLKPYLRESRQKKIDQYVNLFKLSGITKLIKKEKGEFN